LQSEREFGILSSALFNIYGKWDESKDGIAVNGQFINNIGYADDTVLLADSAEGLQRLIVVEASNK